MGATLHLLDHLRILRELNFKPSRTKFRGFTWRAGNRRSACRCYELDPDKARMITFPRAGTMIS